MTFEQLAQASLDSKNAVVQQIPSNSSPENRLRPVNKQDPQPDAPKVKGVYATAHSAGGSRLHSLLELMDRTELNALVVDVKDDWGYITYDTGNPDLLAMDTTKNIIRDMPALINLRSMPENSSTR